MSLPKKNKEAGNSRDPLNRPLLLGQFRQPREEVVLEWLVRSALFWFHYSYTMILITLKLAEGCLKIWSSRVPDPHFCLTIKFHLVALPASHPQNVSQTKSIMFPTKPLFSGWHCFCSRSHHSLSLDPEPQPSLNVPSLVGYERQSQVLPALLLFFQYCHHYWYHSPDPFSPPGVWTTFWNLPD